MATNFYFNNFGASQEQNLIEDLIIESIKMYGIDTYYIPRTLHNKDVIYREGEYYSFDAAFSVEMYIKNTMAMEGEGEFLSKFGIQVNDQITFTMAQRVYTEEVGDYTSKDRPQEGDLIYFPLTQAVYQIKFVNKKAIFYQLGALQTYDITCELFAYNNEEFNCGIPYIDDKYNALSTNMGDDAILAENSYILTTESGYQLSLESYRLSTIDVQAQNEEFEDEGQDFIDFTEIDPFSEGTRV
jgi:hypothetical protein